MITTSTWLPDFPDFRDNTVYQWNRNRLNSPAECSDFDLSEYFLPVESDNNNPSAAISVGSLVEFFNRRFGGEQGYVSKQFIAENGRRYQDSSLPGQLSIRSALKSIAKLGVPPARFETKTPIWNDSFLYSFSGDYKDLKFYRVDSSKHSPKIVLHVIKSLLITDRPCVFGFSISSSTDNSGIVNFQPVYDSIVGSSTGVIVGFDDTFRTPNKGAFLFRSSFGCDWGDNGYGWLDYRFVENALIGDVWTLDRPQWTDDC